MKKRTVEILIVILTGVEQDANEPVEEHNGWVVRQ